MERFKSFDYESALACTVGCRVGRIVWDSRSQTDPDEKGKSEGEDQTQQREDENGETWCRRGVVDEEICCAAGVGDGGAERKREE